MSSDFVELGLLVTAAFALGLFVGWLAWSSAPRRSADVSPAHTSDDRPAKNPGLPEWQIERIPTNLESSKAPWSQATQAEPTVRVGPRGSNDVPETG